MNDKKNIDRLFQEKFKDFEVAPNDAIWDRINESLPKKKKKRRVIALWWQIGGVAAVIALLLTVGISVFNSDEDTLQEFPIVDTKTNENNGEKNNKNSKTKKNENELNSIDYKTSKIANSNLESEKKSNLNDSKNDNLQKATSSNPLTSSNNSNQKTNAVANKSKVQENNNVAQKRSHLTSTPKQDNSAKVTSQKTSNSTLKTNNKTQLKSEIERKSVIKKNIEDNKATIAENRSSKKHNSETTNSTLNKTNNVEPETSIIENPQQESIENAIAENNETIEEEEKEDDLNRWSIAPNVAPVYFNSFGKGSSLDQQFNENSKSADVNMSYGISGSYAISKKIKVRAGVNRVNLNQTTSDVFAYTSAETVARGVDASFNNISFKDGVQHVSLISSNMLNRSSTPELFNTKLAGDIDQRFGFIEIPLEIEYRLLDQKFGINVIGGFSTLFLNENEIYADLNGSSTLIGEANNINDTSFSANFGLGMDYSLSKQWNLNLEPTFKYQINTFNNTTGDFKPFFIGVYTGLSYKF